MLTSLTCNKNNMNTEQDGRDLADYPALSFGFVSSQINTSKCKLSELGDQLVPFLRTQLFWSDQEKYSCLKVWHWKVVPFLSTMRVPTSFHQTKFQIQRANFIWETPIGGIFHPKSEICNLHGQHVDYKFLYGGIFQVNLTMWITRGRKQSADQPAKTKYVLFSFKIKNL